MRCKNCGFDNEEGRYICANCGSPLYDEDEEITDASESNNGYAPNQDNGADDDDKNKKSIIIIIVLAVILVALIAGIVVSAVTGKDEETTTESTTISTTTEETTKKQTTTKKEITTEKETTTESTTTTTQAPSTTATVLYNVYIDIDGNGTVTGDGSYEKGKKAVLTATPDEGWQFEGWYDNSTGALVASGNKFTVNVSKDVTYTARFTRVEEAQ